MLLFLGGFELLPLAASLLVTGAVFLSLAEILDRVRYIEFLLKSSSIVRTDRIKTDIGEFEKLGKVEGEAMCAGCRRTAPRAGLYYNEAMDVHYHPECLARDRGR
jgi:hypothetical protein